MNSIVNITLLLICAVAESSFEHILESLAFSGLPKCEARVITERTIARFLNSIIPKITT